MDVRVDSKERDRFVRSLKKFSGFEGGHLSISGSGRS